VRILYDESDPETIIGFLGTVRDINDKKISEEQLKTSNLALEERVLLRTSELEKTNKKLRDEIKRRVKADEALEQSEKDYKGLFRIAHDAILIFDPNDDEKVLEVNEQACSIYGFTREELIGMSLKKISDNVKRGETLISKTIREGAYHTFETLHYTKSGRKMILEVNATKVTYSGRTAILSINRDITAKREVELKLKEERNHRVSALIDGQEMERKRLSRELHDGLGQLLTASLIYLKQLYNVVENKKSEDLVDKTREIIQNTVEEVRTISHNLMPSVLDDFGLELALQNMINSINGKFNGSIQFHSEGNPKRLNADIEIGLYRIAQEALNNALKYSQADTIDISLTSKNGHQKLSIRDNGIGFDINKAKTGLMSSAVLQIFFYH